MSTIDYSLSHRLTNTNDPKPPNSQIAANKAVPLSSSSNTDSPARENLRLHGHIWYTCQISETKQFRVTTHLDQGRHWKVEARDWYWTGSEWARTKVGGLFRAPYGLEAAKAVVAAASALRTHGVPFDDKGVA